MDVALVTGDAPGFAATVDAPLEAALRERGVTVHAPRWDDPTVDWSSFAVAVVRTVWDYPGRRDEFIDWAASTGAATSLWNPADVLRWNTHKSYLIELEERGAPVVPTAWLAQGDRASLAELVASRGWRRVVIKPAVAAGSDGLLRTDGDHAPVGPAQAHLDELLSDGDVMVQPYLPSVETAGEVSVVLVDGAVTHVVRKQPPPGEFRIQEIFGGRYQRVDLDGDGAAPAALGSWVYEAVGHDLLYARVDLLLDENGAWQVAEVELTEPDLYLGVAPEVGDTLARAVLARA
ncbi:MAG: hypothetical protein WEB03_12235 [Nitriliruptor sp.]|uniref:RimK family alpha-L-glutamate ligase n=1 Tax=Nitriliruptor sp. TaxID=2448056 RepID=UPI00349FFCA1